MNIENLGLIDYRQAYDIQLSYLEKVQSDSAHETLLICSHPPVVTLGRKSTSEDLVGWEGAVEEIERGGKATYHGPSQVVVYPILDLKQRNQDIAGFLEAMESAMISCLSAYNLVGLGNLERGKPDYTGVWIEHEGAKRKIASIGVAVKRWVTYHGLAFNLFNDAQAFTGINPCGFTTDTMISLEEAYGERVIREEFERNLCNALQTQFNKLRNS